MYNLEVRKVNDMFVVFPFVVFLRILPDASQYRLEIPNTNINAV